MAHASTAHLVSQVAQLAESVPVLDAQDLEGVRHDKALLLVVWVRHALKALEALQGSSVQGSSAAGRLVGNHAACTRAPGTRTNTHTMRKVIHRPNLTAMLMSPSSAHGSRTTWHVARMDTGL